METDADRLASIKGLGGLLVRADSGEFWAIFDAAYVDALGVDESGPALTARSVDVQALRKGATVSVDGRDYRIRTLEPDGTGMTLIRLGA